MLRRPVFFVGCPRSGTSIAVRLFAQHPDIANWSEAMEVWDPRQHDDPWADHHWGRHDLTSREIRRLHAAFEFFRRRTGRARFVNKHPRSSVRIDALDMAFPDASFVHIIRDGRAVASSIVRKIESEPSRQSVPVGNFCKPPDWRRLQRPDAFEQAALQWRDIVRFVLDRRSDLGERYVEVRYEQLCAAPREKIGSVWDFAGLAVDAEMIERLPDALTAENHKYAEHMTSSQVQRVETVQRALLDELGYP